MSDAGGATVKALACPACGAPVELRAPGVTVSVVCGACGSTLDALAPDLAIIEKAEGLSRRSRIPLGTRGRLDGVDWDAVGYMERAAGSSRWSEYLLFNPYHGYRFLIDDGRCWSLGRLIDGEPASGGLHQRVLGDLRLERFEEPYDAAVRFVLGEFYWRVRAGDYVRVTDYVAAGVMLSLEEAEDEVTWTRIDLLGRGMVEVAFGVPDRRNLIQRPSPHEPSPWRPLVGPLWMAATLAVLLLFGLCLAQPSLTDFGGTSLTTRLDAEDQTATIGPFDLTRGHSRVTVRTWSRDLDNQWIDVDLSLVNEATQTSYDGYALVEHYTGRDSDGPWSEGATDSEVVFSHVPAGRYNLVIDHGAHAWASPTADPYVAVDSNGSPAAWAPPAPTFGVSVQAGGMAGWNLTLSLLALLALPSVVNYASYLFERRRRGEV